MERGRTYVAALEEQNPSRINYFLFSIFPDKPSYVLCIHSANPKKSTLPTLHSKKQPKKKKRERGTRVS